LNADERCLLRVTFAGALYLICMGATTMGNGYLQLLKLQDQQRIGPSTFVTLRHSDCRKMTRFIVDFLKINSVLILPKPFHYSLVVLASVCCGTPCTKAINDAFQTKKYLQRGMPSPQIPPMGGGTPCFVPSNFTIVQGLIC